ncbi:Cytochrome b-c1 complex subunit 7 [Boothiomyces macroporosus]|uniref:Complex III subunit 7 n=1 Tax=Boothiomyces macroporosus TaxID=261099 RepID=A0AAD5UBW7_9FUNG|nr:Cytochrome b-c1 complex subunit 7 [Boothiomyces macroporosus]
MGIVNALKSIRALKKSSAFTSLDKLQATFAVYRTEGLFYDDLIPEENEIVQEALRRLTPQQQADRLFRIRRALSLSLKKTSLPSNEWTTAEQDVPYLQPVLAKVESEIETKFNFENLTSIPPALLARNKSS